MFCRNTISWIIIYLGAINTTTFLLAKEERGTSVTCKLFSESGRLHKASAGGFIGRQNLQVSKEDKKQWDLDCESAPARVPPRDP